jgi:type I restriction enzyme S subunit
MSSAPKWPRVCLSDVCEAITDCVNKTAPTVEGPTTFKMIRTTNVRDGWLDLSEVKYVTKEVFEKWNRRGAPRKGDVILTREAPLGEVGMLRSSEFVFLGQRLVMYRADPERLDGRFLLYAFQGDDLQSQIRALGSGSTVEHMRVPDAKALMVQLPPLPVQDKVAGILSAYDDLIENSTRRIQVLEEMAQAIYREWFVNFRFPGHEQVEMVESEMGPTPSGWDAVRFTRLAEVLSGGTPKTTVSEYWNGAIPFFTPKDAPSSFYVTGTEKTITEAGLAKCASRLYPKDTVFITARGTVGKVAMPAEPMATNQSCYALQGRDGVDQLFVFFAIRESVNALQQRAHGAVFDTIIMDTFDRLSIVRPPTDIINRFVCLARPIVANSLNLTRRNAVLRQTRDLLLPKLISGELDVKDLDIETGELAA